MVRVAIALFTLLMVLPSAALAEKRVALVIGNSDYKHAGTLTNPRNDAEDFAAALKALGIEVIKGLDLDKRGMEQEVRKFSTALTAADVGIFFYAGHGLQVNGNNYLVPVDAELLTADALEFEMVRADLVQRLMENSAKTNILFLDACRNNPLSRNLARALGTRSAAIGRGLAPAESGVGTLISFSTQPGNVASDGTGRNSPYSGPLVKRIGRPGQDVLTVLTDVRNEVLAATGDKQVPWENHALRARFYFNTKPVVSKSPEERHDEAERTWSWIKDTTNQVVLENFIRQFGDTPSGAFARERLHALKRQQVSAVPPRQSSPESNPRVAIPTKTFFKGQTASQYLVREQLLNVNVVNNDNQVLGTVDDFIVGVGDKIEGLLIAVGTSTSENKKRIGARLAALKIATANGRITISMPSATKEIFGALDPYSTPSQPQTPSHSRTGVAIPIDTFFKGLTASQYLAREKLLNATVVNNDNQAIGTISDLIVGSGDKIEGVILDAAGKKLGVQLGALKLVFSDGKLTVSMPSVTKELLSAVAPYQRPSATKQ
jgi:hypothetical protein